MVSVLVIDSDEQTRCQLAGLLGAHGHQVYEESDSKAALAQVLRNDPDLIVVSENMPRPDSEDLVTVLRRVTPSPIIVVGSGGELAIVRALLMGADMYISRPINNREFLGRVRALLRRAVYE